MRKEFKNSANLSGVYQIKNIENGKVYIGSAKSFKKRANQHNQRLRAGKHQNKHLLASWKKWGEDAFIFEVLEVVEGTTSKRRKIEQQYIDQYLDNWEQCYNLCKKVVRKQGPWSKTPEESKKARKGKHHSPATEYKKGNIPWTKTNGHSEETKAVIGQKSKKTWSKKSHRRKMGKIHHSDEYRSFQGNRIKEMWANPEYRKSRLEFYKSEDHKEDLRKKIAEKWKDPEYHQRLVAIHNSLESKIKKARGHLNSEQAKYLLNKDWLKEEYSLKKRMIKSIAEELQLNRDTVSKWIKNFELN